MIWYDRRQVFWFSIFNIYRPPNSIAGDLPSADIAAGVERWLFGNRIRLIVELFGFIFSIIALRVWSAENISLDERAG